MSEFASQSQLGTRTVQRLGRSPFQRRGINSLRLAPAYIVLVTTVCFIGLLVTGTSVYTASMLSVGLLTGLFSILVAGGIATVSGMLTGILVAKYLFIGIVLKILMLESFDKHLLAPVNTPAVAALGFLGLLIGTLIQRHLPGPRRALIPPVRGARMYLALTMAFIALGYGGYFISLGADLSSEAIQTGGILGFAHAFSSLRTFCIVPAMYFAWARQGQRFMTHPLVLSLLAAGLVLGVFATGKQAAMEPLVFYIAISFIRYGLRDRRLLALSAIGISYYALIIYPYSQYVRHNGGREGNLSSRVTAVVGTFWSMVSDPDFRQTAKVETTDHNRPFFDSDKLDAFGRFIMIGEADRLIGATDSMQAFSGWETITWGFRMLPPSFIYPDKPIFGTGNYLGQITGEVGPDNVTTQISYGVMANFYNAFGMPGVFVGSVVFFGFLYYSFRFWYGSPVLTKSSTGSSLWVLLLIATFHHSVAEESLAGLVVPTLEFPLIVFFIFGVAKLIYTLMPPANLNAARHRRHSETTEAFVTVSPVV
jgi:hypothetical protein